MNTPSLAYPEVVATHRRMAAFHLYMATAPDGALHWDELSDQQRETFTALIVLSEALTDVDARRTAAYVALDDYLQEHPAEGAIDALPRAKRYERLRDIERTVMIYHQALQGVLPLTWRMAEGRKRRDIAAIKGGAA